MQPMLLSRSMLTILLPRGSTTGGRPQVVTPVAPAAPAAKDEAPSGASFLNLDRDVWPRIAAYCGDSAWKVAVLCQATKGSAQAARQCHELAAVALLTSMPLDEALVWAATHGWEVGVASLLRLGANVGHKCDAALRGAATKAHAGVVSVLVAAGAAPDTGVLNAVAGLGCAHTMAALLDAKEQPDQPALRTALLIAAGGGMSAVVEQLLHAHTDLLAQHSHEAFVLQLAGNRIYEPRVHTRFQDGSWVFGRGTLVGCALRLAVFLGREDTVRLLVDTDLGQGLSVHQLFACAELAGEAGSLLLALAVLGGSIMTLRTLLDAGADARGAAGHRALHDAATDGRLDAVQMLLEAGADPSGPGSLALVGAAGSGHLQVVRVLLAAGAAAAVCKAQALNVAVEAGHAAVVQVLLEGDTHLLAGERTEALVTAACLGHGDVVEVLLAMGADPRAQNCAALCAAAQSGSARAVRALLAAGAEAQHVDPLTLPLMFAAGHAEAARLLLEAGVADLVLW